MTYYCVTTSIDNRGRVTANITNTQEASKRPESSFFSTCRKDIYNDWFSDLESAQLFVREARKA